MTFKPFFVDCVTTAGLQGVTLRLARYWSKRECPVTAIDSDTVSNGHYDELQTGVGEFLMNGRMVDPHVITNFIMSLFSETTRCMTGQIVNVDDEFRG